MALINLSNAYLSFSDHPLLNYTNLYIEKGERVCIVGRNGAGKSTLLKILAKIIALDDGILQFEQNTIINLLQQDQPRDIMQSVYDYVAEGVAELSQLLKKYHKISNKLAQNNISTELLEQLAQIQQQLDHHNGWHFERKITEIIKNFQLNSDDVLADLSGGWLRRASLAKALVKEPNVLLLDEPTNHLDIEAIQWLETFLLGYTGSLVFVSHDRAFIQKIATRIIDLDRGILVSYPGEYNKYIEKKQEDLRVESLQNQEFDKKLAQEEIWIRQGIKARRTRNEGRVKALKALRKERASRIDVLNTANINIIDNLRSGKIIFNIEQLNYAINNKILIKNFNATILRGDKIALIGPNGCGKSTLIKLLLKEIQATSGKIESGTKLEIAYFDQYRSEIDLDKTVMENVADGKQDIEINGKKRHVLGYLQEFLFPPKRAMTPAIALSGGERNRLLLAKLLLKPNNLLILDEPTNDLDVETLELLEDILSEYNGTVLIVSHDRQFIDNVATSCLIFEGDGNIFSYAGGYTDAKNQQTNSWQQKAKLLNKAKTITKHHEIIDDSKEKPTNRATKLSYNEQKELNELPDLLLNLEKQIAELEREINMPEFFNLDFVFTQEKMNRLTLLQKELDDKIDVWEKLESKKQGSLE